VTDAVSSVVRRSPATLVARLRAGAFGLAVGLADLTSPGIRYGYVHPLAGRVLRRPLATLGPVPGVRFELASAATGRAADVRCGLFADQLDSGGIGRVLEMLAVGFGAAGIAPVVVCPADGDRVQRLRDAGVEVLVMPAGQPIGAALRNAGLDAVQVHSAPRHLVAAALALGVPVVPVLHNTEIHYDEAMWRETAALFDRAAAVVAVSDVVRQFHAQRLPRRLADKIVVVANGSMPVRPMADGTRDRARLALAETLGVDLEGEVVVVCLARYDSQKNIAATVAAFLSAAAHDERMRLVVAGEPSDWLEYRRADAIRRLHPHGDRVHLLGICDAASVLVASDAFVLDSFFEGWPLAATEAVAAGLPVVLSDTGGAAELVDRAVRGSALIPNPTGPADRVTDRVVRAARRRATHQPNAGVLAAALSAAVDTARRLGPARPPLDGGFDGMVAGHAGVVRAAIEHRRDAGAVARPSGDAAR